MRCLPRPAHGEVVQANPNHVGFGSSGVCRAGLLHVCGRCTRADWQGSKSNHVPTLSLALCL
jgi:hypothetical protein